MTGAPRTWQRALIACLVVLCSCATPVAPSGGPPDDIPPEIVESDPLPDAVNVDQETVQLTFSEYIDEQSFTRAFAITPEFSRPPDFSWGRRSVEIRFPEPLRENTTYVLTLDRNLRDQRGVALPRPITVAFSTGPTISRGTIAGRVVAAETGAGAGGVDVLAYALDGDSPPAELPARPAYRTQTDQNGSFTFEYLTEQSYYVAALRDQNRNVQPDPQESFAPPPVAAIPAEPAAVDPERTWFMAAVDTTRPFATRVQSLSATRHQVRFSEPVEFVDREPSAWTLIDSTNGQEVPIESVYMQAAAPRDVYFRTSRLDGQRYSVAASAVVDTSGNTVIGEPVSFTPSVSEDTLEVRLLGLIPPTVTALARDVQPVLRFNAPVDKDLLEASVTVTDSIGIALPYSAVTENGTDFEIHTDPPLSSEMPITITISPDRLAGLDSTMSREFTRLSLDETGEISGTVLAGSDPVIIYIEPDDASAAAGPRHVKADSYGQFIVRELPAGTYRLRAFVDVDQSGEWDPGLFVPYRPPEPLLWHQEPVRVRARWETALPDTLRMPPL